MRRNLFAALLASTLAGAAQADIIWDQSDIDTGPTSVSFVDGTYIGGFFGNYSNYVVSDIHISSESLVQSVTVFYSNIGFPEVTSAVLNIFPKSGTTPLASNDPRPVVGSGQLIVPVIGGYIDDNQAVMTVTADGLSIVLAPGDYWVGLSPTLPDGFFGGELHWSTTTDTNYGDPSVGRYYDSFGPGAWGGSGADPAGRDAAIRIEGIIPAPTSAGALALAGLAAARRRRN